MKVAFELIIPVHRLGACSWHRVMVMANDLELYSDDIYRITRDMVASCECGGVATVVDVAQFLRSFSLEDPVHIVWDAQGANSLRAKPDVVVNVSFQTNRVWVGDAEFTFKSFRSYDDSYTDFVHWLLSRSTV
ncbi:hypothetical protein LCGC14_3117980 [marine sediment metagenome]|uniref:Uncharacterized protein n=1 Tax=marine sediment metagenome TaxID=412755 RepID=A0A0F8YT03_9ZZZZ